MFRENDSYSIFLDDTVSYLLLTWGSGLSSKELYDSLTTLLQVMKDKQVTKILWDTRYLEPIHLLDQQYVKAWIDQAVAAGYQVAAVLPPYNTIMHLIQEQFLRYSRQKGVLVKSFDDLEVARIWLISTPALKS